MARVDGVRDARLIRRNMEYVETCEYRLNGDTTPLRSNVRNASQVSSVSRQGVQTRDEDNESIA